jgi:hypothetical protein
MKQTGLSAWPEISRSGAIALLVLAITCSHGTAQDAPACADSVARALTPLVGTWDVRTVFRNGERWDTTAAVARIEPDFQGCLLRELLVGSRYGQPFRVLNLWGAVGMHGPIQRSFVHSQHGLLTVYSGQRTPEGLVLADSQIVDGELVLFQHRFEPFGGDSMRFSSRRSVDHGGSWILTWFADYRRRAQ